MIETGGARDHEVEVRLLGPMQALKDGRPVTLVGAQARAVLAVLALEPGSVVSVDRLLECLWPAVRPQSAGHALQVYISRLRKALGAAAISTSAPGYALEVGSDSVDVGRFIALAQAGRADHDAGDFASAETRLREALAVWRGTALADFRYEPFAQLEIARLEDLRLVALEDAVESGLALGRHLELVPELKTLVSEHPLRERPHTQLMLALYRSGRQADALAVYRGAREILVEELGIEPGPELRTLEAAILRQDESLRPPAPVSASATGHAG
jgi:DNA-binding SARP family transcriptional activator